MPNKTPCSARSHCTGNCRPVSGFQLGERVLSARSGAAKDKAPPPVPCLAKRREEYDQAAGWNRENGKPWQTTLAQRGLADFEVGTEEIGKRWR